MLILFKCNVIGKDGQQKQRLTNTSYFVGNWKLIQSIVLPCHEFCQLIWANVDSLVLSLSLFNKLQLCVILDQFSFPNPIFPITLQMISLSRFCWSASDYLNALCFGLVDVFFIYFSYRYDEDEEGIWLHCVRYSGPGWSYECPYPDWAHLCWLIGLLGA